MNMVRIALIQSRMSVDPDQNLRRAGEMVEEAARGGGRIICLPELYRTRYFPQTEDPAHFALSEPADGVSVRTLAELAGKLEVTILVPIFEQRAPGLYHNSVITVNDMGEVAEHYRKLHIPDDPRFYEKYYFAPGDRQVTSVKCQVTSDECQVTRHLTEATSLVTRHLSLRVSTLICWDQWFPETARLAALSGAEILFYPTAIGWHESETPAVLEEQRDAWITMHRAHAIANGIFVAAANRVGVEGELTFWGTSLVVNPAGRMIAQAGQDQEEILYADCDLNQIAEQRHGWPFLRDRRVDAYGGLSERFIDNEAGGG